MYVGYLNAIDGALQLVPVTPGRSFNVGSKIDLTAATRKFIADDTSDLDDIERKVLSALDLQQVRFSKAVSPVDAEELHTAEVMMFDNLSEAIEYASGASVFVRDNKIAMTVEQAKVKELEHRLVRLEELVASMPRPRQVGRGL